MHACSNLAVTHVARISSHFIGAFVFAFTHLDLLLASLQLGLSSYFASISLFQVIFVGVYNRFKSEKATQSQYVLAYLLTVIQSTVS